MSELESRRDGRPPWPELPYEAWKDTYETLHLWSQIVGKTRLASSPWINHGWHVTLYVTARGLTTSLIPYDRSSFQVDFDFIDHNAVVQKDTGEVRIVKLYARSVADFYSEFVATLDGLALRVPIHGAPNEVPNPIPFAEDHVHAAYDPEQANRFWRILLGCSRVFGEFRAGFRGKCSPVHFWWGSFDLAVTRFSGRRAPEHAGGVPGLPDRVSREAYSHEVCSAGFWPGGESYPHPMFYSYAYPTPPGMSDARIAPAGAGWNLELGEFVLPYDAMRATDDPDATLAAFLETTYGVAAELGGWDRRNLEWGTDARPETRIATARKSRVGGRHEGS